MKKWHIIVISCVLAVGILVGGGTFFYKYYIVPNYLKPVVEKASEYLKDDDVLDALYEQAERLHEDGVIEDETYSDFIRAYRKHAMSNEDAAREILDRVNEGRDTEEDNTADTSVTARYASSRVGVEIVQTNESGGGKSETSYSSERTSDRIRSEDVVEAERIVEEATATDAPDIGYDEDEDDLDNAVEDAYAILRDNMSSAEYSAFASIMGKLDVDVLISYANDLDGMKAYMHSRLSDSEYSNIVNLGYKYAYLFME